MEKKNDKNRQSRFDNDDKVEKDSDWNGIPLGMEYL